MAIGALILFAIWVALTRRYTADFLVCGAVFSFVLALLWTRKLPSSGASILRLLRRPFRLVTFAATLFWRFVRSTLFTCRLILSGQAEGRIMALPMRVEDPVGQFLLLNSITFTPSTISLLIEEDILYIHWLQRAGGSGDWQGIKESLELRIRNLFGTGGRRDRR